MARTLFGLLAVVLIGWLPNPASAAPVHGTIMIVHGNVEIQRNGSLIKARVGTRILPHDTIITSANARVKIVMSDQNILNVLPNSKLNLQKYIYKPAVNKKDVILSLIYGKVRSSVQQKYHGSNKYQVKTPNAVAGVRGTDFLTSYNRETGQSQIVTFRGVVAVGRSLPNGLLSNIVDVRPSHTTVVKPNQAPSAPAIVPPTKIQQLKSETDASTNTSSTPSSPTSAPTKTGKKQKADHKPSGTTAANHNPGQRQPASTSTSTTHSQNSMVNNDDLGPTAAGTTPLGSGQTPTAPANFQPISAPPPTNVTTPSCTFCTSAISNSPTQVNIQLTKPPGQ